MVLLSYSVRDVGDNRPKNFTTKFTKPMIKQQSLMSMFPVLIESLISVLHGLNINPGYNNCSVVANK